MDFLPKTYIFSRDFANDWLKMLLQNKNSLFPKKLHLLPHQFSIIPIIFRINIQIPPFSLPNISPVSTFAIVKHLQK